MDSDNVDEEKIIQEEDNAEESGEVAESFEPISTFTEALDYFINFAERVLKQKSSGGGSLLSGGNQSNAIQVALTRYRTVYNRSREGRGHVEKFTDVYNKCKREQLLDEVDLEPFMEWFTKTSFVIAPLAKSKSKIMLTAIYRNCCRIADDINEEAEREKDPQKSEQLYNNPANLYPEMFMLHLFRIFSHCADEIDNTTIINKYIGDLEELLGLSENQQPTTSSGGFGDIFSSIKKVASNLGINLPDNVEPPDMKQLGDAMESMSSDPTVKNVFGEMMKGVNLDDPSKLPSTLPAAVGKLMERMADNAKEVPETVKRSMQATTENPTGE